MLGRENALQRLAIAIKWLCRAAQDFAAQVPVRDYSKRARARDIRPAAREVSPWKFSASVFTCRELPVARHKQADAERGVLITIASSSTIINQHQPQPQHEHRS